MILTGDGDYVEEHTHHHHQAPNGAPANPANDVRQAQTFPGYSGSYPPTNVGGPAMPPNVHDGMGPMSQHSSNAIAASKAQDDDDKHSLFGDIPEAKKRKFILVDDPVRGSRVRVRVTLDTVEIKEIPDSYRKSNSVYPRSWFPMQMQSPPPSARGSRFFENDDAEDDGKRGRTMVPVPTIDGGEMELPTPKMRRSQRSKEVKLNDLGYRMTWHQSRVFAGRTVFLQRARKCPLLGANLSSGRITNPPVVDCWRNKVRSTMGSTGQEVSVTAPHFETRVGKRRWAEHSRRAKKDDDN